MFDSKSFFNERTHRNNGTPLAAPSANKFGKTSPTCADHILIDHNHTVPVLDGGPCTVGVESTILDLSVQPPAIRRLGAIGKQTCQISLPYLVIKTPTAGTQKAHYAPSTSLFLSTDIKSDTERFKLKDYLLLVYHSTDSETYTLVCTTS